MTIVLYYAPVTCAMAPYITLTEAGAAFETRPVNMRKGGNRTPDFLKLNPKHQVPVMVVDGEVLTESTAIQIWIARRFPAAKLLPQGEMAELRAVALMSFCAAGIHPFLARINAPARVCDAPGAEAAVVRAAAEQLYEKFAVADDLLAGRQFFFEHFTAPDAHFFWCYRRGTQFDLELKRFKHATAHFERMLERPSVKKLLAFEQQVQADFAKVA